MTPAHGFGRGYGRGGPGRRRGMRRIEFFPGSMMFGPLNRPLDDIEFIEMGVEHIEALRHCDIDGLTQEEASDKMGISRRTLWSDLKEARSIVAKALIEGKGIRIIDKVSE